MYVGEVARWRCDRRSGEETHITTSTMHGIYETISDKASIRITCDTYISSATDRLLDACCRRHRLVDRNRMFCPGGRRLQARTRAFVPFTRWRIMSLGSFCSCCFVASQVSTKNGENIASYVKLNEKLNWNFRNEVKTMGEEADIFCSLDGNDWSHSLVR
jgi:hypothetical protein